MLRKFYYYLAVLIIILLSFTGCASGGETAKQVYPEAWEYLKSTYGKYIRIDKDGDFVWNFGDGVSTKLLPEEDCDFYTGEDFLLNINDVENSAEIGYAARYIIINNARPDYGIHGKIPKLQVYLSEHWWTLETQPHPGSDIGIWIEQVYRRFSYLTSMMARGTEENLPEGRYRLVLDFNPEYDAVLAAEFYNEPDEVSLNETDNSAQNMKELYPEAWETLRSTYGEYLCIDEDGDFAWNINAELKIKFMPADEYNLYNGNDLTLEYDGITYWEKIGRAAKFTLTNHTGQEIAIYNKLPYLQIYLDREWWYVPTEYSSISAIEYNFLDPGANHSYLSFLAVYSQKPLPDGRYRLLIDLTPIYNSYIAVEFDVTE